jgi:hypothetical protein
VSNSTLRESNPTKKGNESTLVQGKDHKSHENLKKLNIPFSNLNPFSGKENMLKHQGGAAIESLKKCKWKAVISPPKRGDDHIKKR